VVELKDIKDFERIEDIDARISARSIKYTGNFSVYEALNLLLEIFTSRLKFLKSLRGLKVKQVFELTIEGANRISEVHRDSKVFPLKYREDFLKLIANSLMKDKRILYVMGSSKEEGDFLGLAVIPTALLSSLEKSSLSEIQECIRAKIPYQESNQMLENVVDSLRDILSQELGQERWNEILETKAGSGLLRSGPIKSWPFVGDTIYTAYNLLLPIYPIRAHMYKQQKWEGEKAKYPKALLKDLVQLFQERFPKDLKELTEENVTRCIQYRMGITKADEGLLSHYFFEIPLRCPELP
jgi:hypothetical protein